MSDSANSIDSDGCIDSESAETVGTRREATTDERHPRAEVDGPGGRSGGGRSMTDSGSDPDAAPEPDSTADTSADAATSVQTISTPAKVIGKFDDSTDGAAGVLGESTSTSGISRGVLGKAGGGTGVWGKSDTGNGVRGDTESDDGIGVYGTASSSSGINYGVYGKTFVTSRTSRERAA